MTFWMKNKLTTIVIAAVAVFALAGAGAVMAAQNPTTPSAPRTSDGAAQPGHEFEAQGVIQQVAFDQGTTNSGSMVFLPDGKQATVTVAFTSATHIEVGSGSSSSQSADASQPGTLQAGMTVRVEGTVQSDGSVLAKEINSHAGDANGSDDNGKDGDGQGDDDHNGQSGSGSGSHDGSDDHDGSGSSNSDQ